MATLPSQIPAPRIGASFVNNSAFIRTNMDAGNVRQRRRFLTAFSVINVEWILTENQFAIFDDFYFSTINFGGDWFQLTLATPYQVGLETARFVAPYQATSISKDENGAIWNVTAQLEVRNLSRSTLLSSLIAAGIDPNGFILAVDRLSRFVNHTQPTQYDWDITP